MRRATLSRLPPSCNFIAGVRLFLRADAWPACANGMIDKPQLLMLIVIATVGHVFAVLLYVAVKKQWRIAERTIYDLPFNEGQVKRELRNSVHMPVHTVVLAALLSIGCFANTGLGSFFASVLATSVWAEIWHYGSHRAFHLRSLHWIHAEHHRSRLNTPFSAISFSLSEKLIFDVGLLGPLALLDCFFSLNFFGLAAWYIGALSVNAFDHTNFEVKSAHYNRWLGKVFTSATYHSMHHARYTGNYGLGTRLLDRMFKTEWKDYEPIYDRICREQRPLNNLREEMKSKPVVA
jgi:Delta7-sterol 5-desaturase